MSALKFKRIVLAPVSRAMKARKIIINKKLEGFPTEANFKIEEETLPAIKDGEFLAQAEFLSVDPYMRLFPKDVGQTVMGEQVAKIIESNNPGYPVGEYVMGEFGWRTLTIGNDKPGEFFGLKPKILKNFGDLPKSLAMSVLGSPGVTAHFGFNLICRPEKGNTVVISAASGSVGLAVGQIAKSKGCRVVGITGSDEKGQRLVDEVGYDAYVNYKKPDFEQKLVEATPDLVDCYYDQVGGEISTSVLYRMNKFGRIAVAGALSTYTEEEFLAREVQTPIKITHSTMEGFKVMRWLDRWDEGIDANLERIKNGQLKYFETVTHGFDNTVKAFIGMMRGENFGKAVVKLEKNKL